MKTSDIIHSAPARLFLHTLSLFTIFVLAFEADRLVFMLVHGSGAGVSCIYHVMLHGAPMDFTVAGYLTALPFLLMSAYTLFPGRWYGVAMRIYFAIVSLAVGIVCVLDMALYGYWNFRLDVTPFFYFSTSPSAAFASVPVETIVIGVAAMILVAGVLWKSLVAVSGARRRQTSQSEPGVTGAAGAVAYALVFIITAGVLFVCIRGGVTVSTMNPGRVYFSRDRFMNHAALNPLFSLLYSATHQDRFADSYRYMTDDEAIATVAALDRMRPGQCEADSMTLAETMLPEGERPDVYLIILESFSNHLFPSMGGRTVALRLDSMAASGVVWDNMYASGFRTDRGIPALLSAQPSLPDASVMKYPRKAEKLPGIAAEMSRQGGYEAVYYYGGDAGFTNMQGYLMASGFSRVISDKDFPVKSRLSKWGAHDDVVFDRVLADIRKNEKSEKPRFTVVQTSSSHEPFDVDYHNPAFSDNPAANAFAYTDSVVASFVDRLRMSPRGSDAIVVLVPDHWGAWPGPDELQDIFKRHLTPMIILGGSLPAPLAGKRFSYPASQTDIAATLLHMLRMDGGSFVYSRNLLDPSIPKYAWMTDRDCIALIMRDENGVEHRVAYNMEGDQTVLSSDSEWNTGFMLKAAKAYLRKICITLHSL